METVTPPVRSRIASVLARSGTGGGLVATAHALLDADPRVVDAAARSLAAEVPTFSAAQKQALARFLGESLGAPDKLSAKTEAALLRVLGALQDANSEDLFWTRLAVGVDPDVRAAALQALGPLVTAPTESQLKQLMACATERDFRLVAPALMILKKLPASAKNAKLWVKLLSAVDVAPRRLAVEQLAGVETAEVAAGLLDQLHHADRGLREDACAALLRFAKGRQALFEKLLVGQTMEECWDLARALASIAKDASTGWRTRLLEEAARHHDRDDRRALPMWFLLREMDIAWTREQIEALALARRKKKQYAEAVGYYRLLAQEAGCSEDNRFELAANGLKISKHDTAVEARQADPALGHFDRLLQNPAFELLKRLSQAKWLDADDLFYLGFHFVEQRHRAREFGKDVLELVMKRAPKAEVGKNARKKLRSAGAG